MKENVLKDKSYKFAIRVVNLYKYLSNDKKEFVLSKQILRSGTAVGALVCEGEFAQSKADFVNKLQIALKEANESRYWLDLLYDTEYIDLQMHQGLNVEIEELIRILVSSVKTLRMKS